MFFVLEEGTASSLAGVREVIEKRGLFSSAASSNKVDIKLSGVSQYKST